MDGTPEQLLEALKARYGENFSEIDGVSQTAIERYRQKFPTLTDAERSKVAEMIAHVWLTAKDTLLGKDPNAVAQAVDAMADIEILNHAKLAIEGGNASTGLYL